MQFLSFVFHGFCFLFLCVFLEFIFESRIFLFSLIGSGGGSVVCTISWKWYCVIGAVSFYFLLKLIVLLHRKWALMELWKGFVYKIGLLSLKIFALEQLYQNYKQHKYELGLREHVKKRKEKCFGRDKMRAPGCAELSTVDGSVVKS